MSTAAVGTALDSARITIENLVRTRWVEPTAGTLRTPVRFPDAQRLESATGPLEREPQGAPWLRLDILWGEIARDSIGPGSLNRGVGIVQLTLFYPKLYPVAPGAAGMTQLADAARAVFSDYFGDCLAFETSSLPERPPDEANWKVAIIKTTFIFYESN